MHAVDSYIESLPEEKAVIATRVRDLLHELVPGLEERFSFRIPFYHYFGMFAYLNEIPEGIDLGFCRGKDLVLAFPQLELRGRAMVASVVLRHRNDIREKNLRELILHAAAWNEEARRQGKSMVRSARKKK
jgi:hypothetical protein